MKKYLAILLLALSVPAMAQHHSFRHHGHHGHHRGPGIGWWVAPVVVGAIGYELGRQQQVIIQQPQAIPVIVQQSQYCSPWTETQNADGTITRTRTCSQ